MKAKTDVLRDFFSGMQTINRSVELFMVLGNEPEFLNGFFHAYNREKDSITISKPHYFRTVSRKFAQKGIIGRTPLKDILGEPLETLEVKLFRIQELESKIHGAGHGSKE